MSQRSVHTTEHSFLALKVGLVLLVLVCVSAFLVFQPAIAQHGSDGSTIGVGKNQSSTQAAESEVSTTAPGTLTVRGDMVSSDLTTTTTRSITVEDPDPVVALAAVDTTNARTVEKAQAIGTTNPLPTAPRILPDVNDGWSVGMASAYSFADNDDGKGNFGTTATASGIPLSDNGITVAVPASQAYRIGQPVAIMYGDKVIVATVTDTGGFGGFGRSLDLAPGCWKALGANTIHDWGVREVYYKFL